MVVGIELGVGREISLFHFIIISVRNINGGKKQNKKGNINGTFGQWHFQRLF